MLFHRSGPLFVVLLVGLMAQSVLAEDISPAIVVVVKPGESKVVSVVWDDVPIIRGSLLWVTQKARITVQEDVDEKQETSVNGVNLVIDKKETERVQVLLSPTVQKGSYTTVAAVLKVSAESGAKPGISKLYARWAGGFGGAFDLRSVEIRVLVEDK